MSRYSGGGQTAWEGAVAFLWWLTAFVAFCLMMGGCPG